MRAYLRLAALVLVVSSLTAGVNAQDRITQLENQVRQLTGDLQRAQAQIGDLERQLEAVRKDRDRLAIELRDARANARPGGEEKKQEQKKGPARVATPDDPMASPASLLKAVRDRYATDMAGIADAPQSQQVSQTRTWIRNVERDYRGKFEWLTRVTGVEEAGRNEYKAMVQVLDQETMGPIGQPFEVMLPGRVASRMEREADRDMWWLDGRMDAKLTYNIDRPEKGAFDVPVFIGPYCEYEQSVRVEGVKPYLPPANIPEQPAPGGS